MDGDDEALTIIRSWGWEGWDYDECNVVPRRWVLSDAVTELALGGDNTPADTILRLLASGKLTASGIWGWQAYINFEHYQKNAQAFIPTQRWQSLLALIAEMDNTRFGGGYEPHINLTELQIGETEKFTWEWRNSSFSYAVASEGDWPQNSEEWFSAEQIELLPPEADAVALTGEAALPTLAIEVNGGGRPTALVWEAVALEMAGRYYRGDFKPKNIADVIREIQDWAGGESGEPHDSTVRPHAKCIFEAFKAWESD